MSDSFAHAQFTSRRVLTVGKRQICAASRANISQLFPAALTAGRVAPAHGVTEQTQTGKGTFIHFVICLSGDDDAALVRVAVVEVEDGCGRG